MTNNTNRQTHKKNIKIAEGACGVEPHDACWMNSNTQIIITFIAMSHSVCDDIIHHHILSSLLHSPFYFSPFCWLLFGSILSSTSSFSLQYRTMRAMVTSIITSHHLLLFLFLLSRLLAPIWEQHLLPTIHPNHCAETRSLFLFYYFLFTHSFNHDGGRDALFFFSLLSFSNQYPMHDAVASSSSFSSFPSVVVVVVVVDEWSRRWPCAVDRVVAMPTPPSSKTNTTFFFIIPFRQWMPCHVPCLAEMSMCVCVCGFCGWVIMR